MTEISGQDNYLADRTFAVVADCEVALGSLVWKHVWREEGLEHGFVEGLEHGFVEGLDHGFRGPESTWVEG